MSDDKPKDIEKQLFALLVFKKIKVACNYILILPYHATVRLEKKYVVLHILDLKSFEQL